MPSSFSSRWVVVVLVTAGERGAGRAGATRVADPRDARPGRSAARTSGAGGSPASRSPAGSWLGRLRRLQRRRCRLGLRCWWRWRRHPQAAVRRLAACPRMLGVRPARCSRQSKVSSQGPTTGGRLAAAVGDGKASKAARRAISSAPATAPRPTLARRGLTGDETCQACGSRRRNSSPRRCGCRHHLSTNSPLGGNCVCLLLTCCLLYRVDELRFAQVNRLRRVSVAARPAVAGSRRGRRGRARHARLGAEPGGHATAPLPRRRR